MFMNSHNSRNQAPRWRMIFVALVLALASLSMSDVYILTFSPGGKLLLVRSLQGMSLWGIQP